MRFSAISATAEEAKKLENAAEAAAQAQDAGAPNDEISQLKREADLL